MTPMTLMTISQVAKQFSLSTRTLRYYEQIGLLESIRQDDYAYRVYDAAALKRLQQIVVLKKLRISLKQIAELINDPDIAKALIIFEASISEIDVETEALLSVRNILSQLIDRIQLSKKAKVSFDLLSDESLLQMMDMTTQFHNVSKEDNTMEQLQNSNNVLNKLKNVRTLYLPPMTVASSHYFGKNPEDFADRPLNEFVRATHLAEIKPDLRVFGFNNPCDPNENGEYGYEFWVTIPENMDVPEPLVKKTFPGGLYAAHSIQMGNFHEWQLLSEWVKNSEDYELDVREPLGMAGSLEEHLNTYHYYMHQSPETAQFTQLDLLIPIKAK